MPEIPSWIRPAEEASYAAQGLQIGAQLGAQQAREAMAQQEAARQQQLQALQQARWEAEYGLQKSEFEMRAQQAARKAQAQLAYQKAISIPGADPLKELLKYGFEMGAPSGAFTALQRQRPPETLKEVTLPSGVRAAVSSAGGFKFEPREPAATEGRLTQADRDELHDLERQQDKLQALEDKEATTIANIESMSPKELEGAPAGKAKLDQVKKRREQIATLEQQIQTIRARSRGESTKRVKVTGPNGQRGTVPEGTTLSEGWTLAQ